MGKLSVNDKILIENLSKEKRWSSKKLLFISRSTHASVSYSSSVNVINVNCLGLTFFIGPLCIIISGA